MSGSAGIYRSRRRRLAPVAERMVGIAVVPGDSQDVMRTKRLLAGVLWLSIPLSVFSVIQMVVVFEAPLAAATIGIAVVTIVCVLATMWLWPSTYPHVMHVIAFVMIAVSTALHIMSGGFLASGANTVWGLIAVLGALAVFADWRATVWLVVLVVAVAFAAFVAPLVDALYVLPNAEYGALFNLVAVAVFVYFMMYYYVRQRTVLLQESDDLLHNILPDAIATRLKASGDTIADRLDSCSILFADIVDFTPMSSGMAPEEVVGLLDEVFSLFDDLVGKRRLEKIKTIGDEYMAAAGVPTARPDHAQVLCDLALAMTDAVADRRFRGHRVIFRIGINSGPVVAGVIGKNKFSYDLWGDAVNTASRMESHGSPGKIQITDATKYLVEEEFVCVPAATVEVKGKGAMQVWYLTGRRA